MIKVNQELNPAIHIKTIMLPPIILYIFYLFTVRRGMVHVDLLGPLICLWAAWRAYHVGMERKKYRLHWIFAALMAFFYGVLEVTWDTMNILGLYPENSLLLEVSYYVPYMMMMMSVFYYFLKERLNLNKSALAINLLFMTVIVMLLWNGVFFSQLSLVSLHLNVELLVIMTFVVDTIMLIAILVLADSSERWEQFFQFPIIVFPYLTYVITDGFYLYMMITNTYKVYDFTDKLYIFAFVFLAIVSEISLDTVESECGYERFQSKKGRRVTAFLWLVPIPIAFFVLGFVDMQHFVWIVLVIALYEMYQYFIQQNTVNKLLLNSERTMNNRLEELVSERTQQLNYSNELLQIEAITDSLTGLKNRKYFYEAVKNKIEAVDSPFSILFIDLNGFKNINDIHGHATGDAVLIEVSKKLETVANGQAILARLGGDEFAMCLDTTDTYFLETFAKAVNDNVKQEIVSGRYRFQVDASIGISRYPEDETSFHELLKLADRAMYCAKKQKLKGGAVVFVSTFIHEIHQNNKLLYRLKFINPLESFQVEYQPRYSFESRSLVGYGVIIHWKEENLRYTVGQMLALAEKCEQLDTVKEWLLDTVFYDLETNDKIESSGVTVFIEATSLLFDRADFMSGIQSRMECMVTSGGIGFDISLSYKKMRTAEFRTTLDKMKKLNIPLTYDIQHWDQGLNTDINKPLGTVHMGNAVVKALEESEKARIYAAYLIRMAHIEGVSILAKGIGSQKTFEILKQLGCDMGQCEFLNDSIVLLCEKNK